jgi:hypothetical protein
MPAKILINVSARRVTLALFAQRRLSEVKSFANDDGARRALADLLAGQARTPVYLMADLVEEDFRSETLPHVAGRARAEMVARKLAQFFRSAPYRAAWRQGRVQDKRRDDQYLFLALTSGDLLRPYLDIIESRRAPLAGIYALPVVSQVLLERLKPKVPGVLLVSLQGGGLRQSFFLDGRLRMSRLTPLEGPDSSSLRHALAGEIDKSRLFLYNTRLFARDAPLQAWVLDPTGVLRDACAAIAPEANFSCHAVGRDELHKVFGMMAESDLPQDLDAVLLCLLGRFPAECNLALPRQTRGFAHLQWRHALHAVAAGAGVLAVAWGGYNLYAYSDYQERAGTLRQEAAGLRARYDEAARRVPAAPASAGNMRKAVEAVDALRAQARTPEAAMRAVGQVLVGYPTVSLSKLAWRYAAGKQGEAALREETEVSAEIRPFDGDYRAALRLIEDFVQALRRQPGVAEVRVLELPVNLDSKAGLSGNTLDAPDAAAAAAQFKLEVVMGRAG